MYYIILINDRWKNVYLVYFEVRSKWFPEQAEETNKYLDQNVWPYVKEFRNHNLSETKAIIINAASWFSLVRELYVDLLQLKNDVSYFWCFRNEIFS